MSLPRAAAERVRNHLPHRQCCFTIATVNGPILHGAIIDVSIFEVERYYIYQILLLYSEKPCAFAECEE